MRLRVTLAALGALLLCALAVTGASAHHRPTPTPTAPAATASGIPGPPAGYTQRYTHDFAHPGDTLGDWVVQPGAGATVADHNQPGSEFGLGVTMNSTDQWAEVISSNAVITQNTFVQGLMYVQPNTVTAKSGNGTSFPPGYSANWPAFWTFGNPWPQNGEIDMLEGQTGRSCEQTHYGTPGNVIDSPSNCGPIGVNNSISTGWITVSMLRTGEQVKVWYGSTYIGQVPLPTTASEKLVFQDQSYSASGGCPQCFGPTVLPSTDYLSNVTVWSK